MESLFGKNWNAEPERPKIVEVSEAVSMIYLEPADSRGPIILDDKPLPEPVVAEVFARAQDEEFSKHAGQVSSATVVPDLNSIIGWAPSMAEFEKRDSVPDHVSPRRDASEPDATLAKRLAELDFGDITADSKIGLDREMALWISAGA
jgi:hypothetical protein